MCHLPLPPRYRWPHAHDGGSLDSALLPIVVPASPRRLADLGFLCPGISRVLPGHPDILLDARGLVPR